MTTPKNTASATDGAGYGHAAPLYQAAGWPAPLPLPCRSKVWPPAGWTGWRGGWPNEATIQGWRNRYPDGNLGLRLPPTVVGLDLDLYKDTGRASYAALVAECGPLPATWMSTSRDDESGIRFFTVPAGVRWAERRAGPGIELVHMGHRYAVVWPSIHPETGLLYHWHDSGTRSARVPAPTELIPLPAAWGQRLSEPPVPQRVKPFTNGERAPARVGLALASLTGALAELAAMTDWRNEALNRKAYNLGGYVGAGQLDQTDVRDQLFAACVASGYVDRHGARATWATIDAGLRAGMNRPRTGRRR